MCSIDENEFITSDLEEMFPFSALLSDDSSIINDEKFCCKCGAKASLMLHRKEFLCQSCFLAYCNHKFRSTIGKAHKVKHGDQILIAYSGGNGSMAMLHMILQGLSDKSRKRIRFHPSLIFIHESVEAEIQGSVGKILDTMLASNLPCYVTSVEMYFKTKVIENEAYERITTDRLNPSFQCFEKFTAALDSLPNSSSKEDFLKQSRLKLLSKIGKRLGFDQIFIGDSTSYLAIELLSGIALGRGSQIPNFVGFVDDRFDVPILRPLREFQSKEIALFNHFSNLSSVTLPSLTTKMETKGSIRKLTETFVNQLQEGFPATVPTIFRTGDKICSSLPTSNVESGACILCLSQLDTFHSEKYSAMEALQLSKILCASVKRNEKCKNECSCNSMEEALPTKLESHLCYACWCLVCEGDISKLISCETLEELQTVERRMENKKKIEEFLL